jgi:hypothetical protein
MDPPGRLKVLQMWGMFCRLRGRVIGVVHGMLQWQVAKLELRALHSRISYTACHDEHASLSFQDTSRSTDQSLRAAVSCLQQKIFIRYVLSLHQRQIC